MGYSSQMVEKDIVEYMLKMKERIFKVFNRDMSGDGSMVEVGWEDLYSRSLLWWIGLRDRYYGVLELVRG